ARKYRPQTGAAYRPAGRSRPMPTSISCPMSRRAVSARSMARPSTTGSSLSSAATTRRTSSGITRTARHEALTMQDQNDDEAKVLGYAAGPRQRGRRVLRLSLICLPAAYITAYVVLRLCGVFYAFYHQGGWDIDGTTHVYALDL